MKKLWLLFLTFGLFGAAPLRAGTGELVYYIDLDFHGDAGTLYNEALEPFPPEGEDFTGRTVWVLGVRVNIIRQTPDGRLEDKTDDIRYARVLRHVVLAYSGKQGTDGLPHQRPFGLSSELVDFDFPSPYAYKMRGGRLYLLSTDAQDTDGLPKDEAVFVKLTCLYDDDPKASYVDTNVMWIDTYPNHSTFCVGPGENTYRGVTYRLNGSAQPVLIVPHMHDHSTYLQLVVNDKPFVRFTAESGPVFSYHNSHGLCLTTDWHHHAEGGHLIPKTLQAWTIAESGPMRGGVLFQDGDLVWSECSYRNPHREADGMGILMMFVAAE